MRFEVADSFRNYFTMKKMEELNDFTDQIIKEFQENSQKLVDENEDLSKKIKDLSSKNQLLKQKLDNIKNSNLLYHENMRNATIKASTIEKRIFMLEKLIQIFEADTIQFIHSEKRILDDNEQNIINEKINQVDLLLNAEYPVFDYEEKEKEISSLTLTKRKIEEQIKYLSQIDSSNWDPQDNCLDNIIELTLPSTNPTPINRISTEKLRSSQPQISTISFPLQDQNINSQIPFLNHQSPISELELSIYQNQLNFLKAFSSQHQTSENLSSPQIYDFHPISIPSTSDNDTLPFEHFMTEFTDFIQSLDFQTDNSSLSDDFINEANKSNQLTSIFPIPSPKVHYNITKNNQLKELSETLSELEIQTKDVSVHSSTFDVAEKLVNEIDQMIQQAKSEKVDNEFSVSDLYYPSVKQVSQLSPLDDSSTKSFKQIMTDKLPSTFKERIEAPDIYLGNLKLPNVSDYKIPDDEIENIRQSSAAYVSEVEAREKTLNGILHKYISFHEEQLLLPNSPLLISKKSLPIDIQPLLNSLAILESPSITSESLQNEINLLQKDIEKISSRLSAQMESINIDKEYEEVKEQYEQLFNEKENLRRHYSKQKREIEDENESLKKEIQRLQKETQNLSLDEINHRYSQRKKEIEIEKNELEQEKLRTRY